MSENIAFLTTIFPMKENYLYDFFNSLNRQTFKDFDVIVVNDDYKNFSKIKEKFSDLNIKELKYSDTPLRNREHGINFILDNDYDIVIFGDSDDYFSFNRVEVIIEKLIHYDIIVNDLSIFNEKEIYIKKYLSHRIKNNTDITIDFVKDKNIFGMSNTALRVKSLGNIIYDSELIALDWYIFSLALLKSGVALFTNETQTFYRQYNENTVGIGKLNKELFFKGVAVKLKHYELLSIEDSQFKAYYNEMTILSNVIKNNKMLDMIISQNISHPLWWEEIKLFKR
tara:strand:- start:2883 stop:3731 length:849 start_codon:yes stop_codon:yes gene_type:complete